MIDEVLFTAKIDELTKEALVLVEERNSIIENHKTEIDAKIDEEVKKFVEENNEKFVYNVVGKELDDVDKRILINRELLKTLNNLVKVPEVEVPETLTVETDLNNL